jgi:hypothetical protein
LQHLTFRLVSHACVQLGLLLMIVGSLRAQQSITVNVVNLKREPLGGVKILFTSVANKSVTYSAESVKGVAVLTVPIGKYNVDIRKLGYGYRRDTVNISPGDSGRVLVYQLADYLETTITDTISIQADVDRYKGDGGMRLPIDPKKIIELASVNPSIEALLITLPGVGSAGEFSTQYRVRGGNFDENLIYINDVEIYRPQLVRAGQNEGLGVTNALLTDRLTFSTGGFQAQYGDKLSSVLDIHYRNPHYFRGTAELGLMTANLHVEGSSRNRTDSTQAGPFSFLIGARRFSTRYLLNSLDTQGDYNPEFLDIQSVFSWTPRRKTLWRVRISDSTASNRLDSIPLPVQKIKVSLLTTASRNEYSFAPSSRETTFGNFQNAFKLFVGYVGLERTNFLTGQTALTVEHTPSFRFRMKYILSGVASEESELISTEGAYRLSDVNTDIGSENLGEEIFIRGTGSELREARNYLSLRQLNLSILGEWKIDRNYYTTTCDTCWLRHRLSWGARFQHDYVDDVLREWTAFDSAQFIRIQSFIDAQNIVSSYRASGFLQHAWRFSSSVQLTSGIRYNYWTLNEQLLVSPRVQLLWRPRSVLTAGKEVAFEQRRLQMRFAVGAYDQPPFYREMRSSQGVVFRNTRAQRSYHLIAGADYNFTMWGRPFHLFAEGYYKHLYDLVPYVLDNVRLRYYPEIDPTTPNSARGYAYGFDAKISGQFLQGIDSWLSFGMLNTRELATVDTTGFVRRPTDQRFQASLFFQDYVPRIPWLRMNMTLVYNSGLPFGPPNNFAQRTTFGAPYYFRVDFGINAVLVFRDRPAHQFGIRSLWVGVELFNLFARANTISYQWIKDIYQNEFAIPNYLSNRLVNVRAVLRF